MQIQSYLGFSLKIIYAKNFQLLQIKWIVIENVIDGALVSLNFPH